MRLQVFLLAVLCALMTTSGQVMLKLGVSNPMLSNTLASGNTLLFFRHALLSPMILAGLVVYGASAALWLVVLARAELSYALPLVSLGFIFSAIYAHFALHESLGLIRIAGIGLIMIGVIFVARS